MQKCFILNYAYAYVEKIFSLTMLAKIGYYVLSVVTCMFIRLLICIILIFINAFIARLLICTNNNNATYGYQDFHHKFTIKAWIANQQWAAAIISHTYVNLSISENPRPSYQSGINFQRCQLSDIHISIIPICFFDWKQKNCEGYAMQCKIMKAFVWFKNL